MVGPSPNGWLWASHGFLFVFHGAKCSSQSRQKKNGKYLQNCANVSKDMKRIFPAKHHTSKAPQIYPKEKLDSSNDAGKRYLASRT